MIVGQQYQLKNEYGVALNFVVARNTECEGIYFIGELAGFARKFCDCTGDTKVSRLFTNHSKHRMTDDELLHVGNRILDVHISSFNEGRINTQQNFQHAIGVSTFVSQYDRNGIK